TVMVSGQGHAVFGMTAAGNNDRANAAATVHLSGDAAGTTQTAALLTASTTAYNPPADPGPGRRWGDYSYVSLDPLDDMTMWTVNQYCSGTNVYGCNVTKILAPPPATPTSTFPSSTNPGQTSVNIVVTGTSVSGSGFYDPGLDMAPPALPFNHITASVSGGDVIVNSVTYTDPTHITININTVGAAQGARNITVTNPDGQSLTGNGIFSILGVVPITSTGLHGKLNNNLTVSLTWSTESESNNKGFYIERIDDNSSSNWVNIGFVNGAGNSVSTKNYSSIDNNIQLDKIYRYRLKQVDFDGNFTYSNEVVIRVKDLQKNILILSSSPNPFKGKTSIKYNLPADGVTTLKVYDITGKEIAVLQSGFQKAGVYTKEFNATKLSSGTYFCKLVFGEETITNQLLLVD
ncbi:MAG: T9SS type A sorting domain-containing protein, partial [Ferruginibacter sp.]